jgi:chromosome condensin MukBEF MukE localization factor
MPFSGSHQFVVGFGERMVLDQARKMVELVCAAEQDFQVRSRLLKIVNRSGADSAR